MPVYDSAITDQYAIYNGDAVEVLRELPENSIDLSVFSPPFAQLFVYSSDIADMGNSDDSGAEFNLHFRFFAEALFRVMKPGRNVCLHLQQLVAFVAVHQRKGLRDFRGAVRQVMEDAGFWYFREAVIPKNPQALRNGSLVLTPTGWVSIEKLQPGEKVIGSDGKETAVTGVYPQGIRPVYRVTFTDGVSVECDPAHQWAVRALAARNSHGRFSVMTTEQLAVVGLRSPGGDRRYEIPILSAPAAFEKATSLPLDPYVVGVLLGDGNITQRSTVSFCSANEVADRLRDRLPADHNCRVQPGTDKDAGRVAVYHITCGEWHRNDVLDALKDLKLHGLRAWEKHVPQQYLFAPEEERRELLRGLLDTDGTVKKNHSTWFTSTSKQLVLDAAFLVQSLGGLARLRTEAGHRYIHNGEKRQGRQQWMINITLPGEWCPFTAERKAERWIPRSKEPHREINSIELIGQAECTCISVEAEDGLFVTEGCVVTHNSQALRTNAHELLFATLERDSADSAPALNDYVLIFKKPGKNAVPVKAECNRVEWVKWARGVWDDIQETKVLSVRHTKGEEEEKHICPLQLEVYERFIRLYSNRGEAVLDPFGGIGSCGHVAGAWGRRVVSTELKPSYYRANVENTKAAYDKVANQPTFDFSLNQAPAQDQVDE